MHRTQIMLEPWQHEALRTLAAARGVSVSAVIRQIVTDHFQSSQKRAKKRLDEIAGVAEGPSDLGVNHDAYLYGLPKRPPENAKPGAREATKKATKKATRKTAKKKRWWNSCSSIRAHGLPT